MLHSAERILTTHAGPLPRRVVLMSCADRRAFHEACTDPASGITTGRQAPFPFPCPRPRRRARLPPALALTDPNRLPRRSRGGNA